MCEAAVKAIEFALSLDSGDTKCFLNMWMQGDFPEIREIWPEAPVEIYIGADSLHPETIAQEKRIKKAAAPIAHRTLRRNAQGQWVREGRYWLDGSPDERLVQNIANQPDNWMLEYAYGYAPERVLTQAALDVLNERDRHIEVELRTPEKDDQCSADELASLATLYMMPPAARDWISTSSDCQRTVADALLPAGWSFMPSPGNRRNELIKAVALGLAELDRLDRAVQK